MSKKRFIKLMMSRGYSRNTATALAAQVSRYGSYAAMYQRVVIELFPTFVQAMSDIIRSVFNGLAAMCDTAAVAFSGLAESFRRAADE